MDMKFIVYLQGNAIQTTVTCKESVVQEWVRDVISTAHIYQNIVGVERIQKDGKTVMIQMCVGPKCLLYQTLYSDNKNFKPCPWYCFPNEGSFIFAGVDVRRKFTLNGLLDYNYVDVEALAVVRWCWPIQIIGSCGADHVVSPLGIDRGWKPGLKVLARSVAHLNIERPDRVMSSDWSAKELSWKQIEFACIDVYACFRVAFELLKHGNEMPFQTL